MIKNVISSHLRADRIRTTRVVDDCIICVPKAQEGEYKEYNPDVEIVTHPDSVVGLSPKRQWIYEKFREVFFLDDDIINCSRVYPDSKHKYPPLKPKEVTAWIRDIYYLCKAKDIKLYGFCATPHPAKYHADKPFQFNKYATGGAFGLLWDERIYFPDWPHFVGEDYWITAINAHFNRFSFIDFRIAFHFEATEGNVGGVADYRTDEKRRESTLFLRKSFGNAITLKKDAPFKRRKSQYEKTLSIPF